MAEKILVIDDDAEFATLIELLLNKKGYETHVAFSGVEALEAGKFSPAVIIQDYMLPDMNGLDLLKGLKGLCPKAHFIIVTARGDEEIAVELMKAGASDYLKKPFDSEKLLYTVENVLKLRSHERELEKLNKELRLQNQELMALNALSAALTSTMLPNEKYEAAVGIVLKNMRADLANIFIAGDGGRPLQLLVSEGYNESGVVVSDCVLEKDVGLASYVHDIKKLAVVADFALERRFRVPEEVHKRGLTSALAVPMKVKDVVKGVLVVYTKEPRSFNSFDMKLMGNFANQLAMSIENDYLSGILGSFQRQWQVTFDAVPDRVTVQDASHRVIMANKAAAESAGLEVKDLVGHLCSWVFHNQKEPIPQCPVTEAIATKKPVHRELSMVKPGETYLIWAYPVLDKSGEIMMVVEYARKKTQA